MLYLFIGQDSAAKDLALAKIKKEFLPQEVKDFNLDNLYAKDLTLKVLQERLLSLPVKAKKRLIVIRSAQNLKEDTKKFLTKYAIRPAVEIVLLLDIDQPNGHSDFINALSRHAKVVRFKEEPQLNAFSLFRQVSLKKTAAALEILNQLLKNGEKPERILGGLRYSCENEGYLRLEPKKSLKALIDCDIDIKTGRLKPEFALEKLVVSLCVLVQSKR